MSVIFQRTLFSLSFSESRLDYSPSTQLKRNLKRSERREKRLEATMHYYYLLLFIIYYYYLLLLFIYLL